MQGKENQEFIVEGWPYLQVSLGAVVGTSHFQLGKQEAQGGASGILWEGVENDRVNQPIPTLNSEQRALSLDFNEVLIHNFKTSGHNFSPWYFSEFTYSSVKTKVKQTLRRHTHPLPLTKAQELQGYLFTDVLKPKETLYFI